MSSVSNFFSDNSERPKQTTVESEQLVFNFYSSTLSESGPQFIAAMAEANANINKLAQQFPSETPSNNNN